MRQICYIYIYSYRLLKDIGISFTHQYSFSKVGTTLSIEKNESLPNNFFGKGIASVSAIIGGNGAGKTSVMRFLMEAVVEGYRIHGIDGVVVYENDGQLEIYQPDDKHYPQLDIETNLPYRNVKGLLSIPVMYYTGHFAPNIDKNDILSTELQGSYIASDQWLLIHDLLSYTNYDSIYLAGRMYSYMSAYAAQNNARICELLMADGIDDILHDLKMPHYVLIGINSSGVEHLANSFKDKVLIPGYVRITKDAKQNSIAKFIYSNIINLIAEKEPYRDALIKALEAWQKREDTGDVLKRFCQFIEDDVASEEIRVLFQTIYDVLSVLFSIAQYEETSDVFYIETGNDSQKLRDFIDRVLNTHFFLTAKFFDIYYSHGLYNNTILSSGEQEMLNLLSRIYYGIVLQPKRICNITAPTLLLLDEAEIGFHPEWQQRYVSLILQFLQKLMLVKPVVKFQVIITSHSPIILSDIPLCCVNILEQDNDRVTKVREGEAETFSENIFNLYRRAFVMRDGLIGAFAADKLKMLFKKAEQGKIDEEMMKGVELIGDMRIKDALLEEISFHNHAIAKRYYQQKLDELNRRTVNEEN